MIIAISVCAAAEAGGVPAGSSVLNQFLADRATVALNLSQPIAACVNKHDTNSPVFHGCIDWHSAVHGMWALTAYTWATGDERYRSLIASILTTSGIASEREHLRADPDFEMPYGRAWFLRLAIDYKRAFGSNALDAFADEIAASLVAYYTGMPPNPLSYGYDNAAWALINLHDYGVARGDTHLVEFVEREVRSHYLVGGACPISTEVDTQEFMAVCTNWAWLVGKVLGPQDFQHWLTAFLPAGQPLVPIAHPTSVHQVGLNFSRAWGLWGLYQESGDARFAAAYLSHFMETYDHPDFWRGEYDTVAHWVAQFGMFALIVTYYDRP